MKWFSKFLIALAVVLLLGSILFFVYLLNARMQATEYRFQIDSLLAAAELANEGQTQTDPGKAVIAEYDGRRMLVVPGNYTALAYYLERDAVSPLFGRPDPKSSLHITILDLAELYVTPTGKAGDQVLISLKGQDRNIVVHVRGGHEWAQLLECCMEGTYHDSNIPLEP